MAIPIADLMSALEKRSAEVQTVFESESEKRKLWEKLFGFSSNVSGASSAAASTTTSIPKPAASSSKITEVSKKKEKNEETKERRD